MIQRVQMWAPGFHVSLAMNGITCIFGKPGTGKTHIANTLGFMLQTKELLESSGTEENPEKVFRGQRPGLWPGFSAQVYGKTTGVVLSDPCLLYDNSGTYTDLLPDTARQSMKDLHAQIENASESGLFETADIPAEDSMSGLFNRLQPIDPKTWLPLDPSHVKPFRVLGCVRSLLHPGDVLVSDCSESCLPPDLQVEYAHLLVLMHRNDNIQLVIISESIDFWHALNLYAKKYMVDWHIDLHETELRGGTIRCNRVNGDNFERLFDRFVCVVDTLYALREEVENERVPKHGETVTIDDFDDFTEASFRSLPGGTVEFLLSNGFEKPVKLGKLTLHHVRTDSDGAGHFSAYWTDEEKEHLVRVSDSWSVFSRKKFAKMGMRKTGDLGTCFWRLKQKPKTVEYRGNKVTGGIVRFSDMKRRKAP